MAGSQQTRKQGGDALNQVLLTSARQSPIRDQRIGPTGPTQTDQCFQQKVRRTPLGPTRLDLSKFALSIKNGTQYDFWTEIEEVHFSPSD